MAFSRRWMKRLEKHAGNHAFVLRDGTSYRYDFDQAAGDLFVYSVAELVEDDPSQVEAEPPPILQAIRNARDPEAAMEPFRPEKTTGAGAFLDPIVLIQDPAESAENKEA
jgi:hypothetical protein